MEYPVLKKFAEEMRNKNAGKSLQSTLASVDRFIASLPPIQDLQDCQNPTPAPVCAKISSLRSLQKRFSSDPKLTFQVNVPEGQPEGQPEVCN